MEWHSFIFKGLKTNIEFNRLGQARRLQKDWMKSKKPERLINLKQNNRGYQTLFFMTEDRRYHYILLHQALAIVFLKYDYGNTNMVIDHIDNDKMNNSIDNLQIITQRENAVKFCIDKKQLPTGVFYFKRKNKVRYRSYIYYDKKQRFLGYFDNVEDASKKYQNALSEISNNKFVIN